MREGTGFIETVGSASAVTHLEEDHQQTGADEQGDEAADEPAEPQGAIVQSHDPHGLLQPGLLLIDHALYDDGHRVHPGQGHEQGHGATHHTQKPTAETKHKKTAINTRQKNE